MAFEPLPSADRVRPGHVSEALDRVLASLGSPPADTVTRIRETWVDLVGPEAAAVLVPVRVQDSTLILRAADPAWASQARWLEAPVVEGLEAVLGRGVVTAVTARVARDL